jgi:2-oxoglutarate/2-oxoacid ferredoxin oxidoreductase subunit alpha
MKEAVSIVLCGEAGQGIQTIENVLAKVLKLAGYNVYATKEYMSRVRGGVNSTTIIVSSHKINSYHESIDLLIPLSKGRTKHLSKRISRDTVILGELENISEGCENDSCRKIEVPYSKIATELGNAVYSNIVAVGVVCGILGIDNDTIDGSIKKYFAGKDEALIKNNIEASKRGSGIGNSLISSGRINLSISRSKDLGDEILLSGAEAIAMGAVAGGCNFISAYPMTPSTGVFTFLSQHALDLGIVAEQAEDEISAMNMALGAWYMGARALVTTSGGGYDLMQEGLSLCGMLESPVVISLGMRPGPATGLPTRTEQGDLNLALYSGHGEFPRIILAPGSLEQAFYLTQKAFNLADKFQVPVFVLFDQYLADSYYNIGQFDLSKVKVEKSITKTSPDYSRYKLTKNGISPRGIPGYGDGLVVADSDEHDEEGHITEDLELRKTMVDKRMAKLVEINKECISPDLIGGSDYKILVVCWGSNLNMVKDAVSELGNKDVSILHFTQVFPLHPDTLKYLKKAKKVVMIENNSTSQFAGIIKLTTGFDINEKILKYDGLPFSVEELKARLERII